MSKVWVITGAGRGMGLSIAKAALAAGHKVVATGRNTDKVAQAVGDSPDLLVVKLDVTSPADAEAAVKAVDRPVWPYRCAGEQCRELLRGLLRGADAGADGAPAGDEPSRSDERHPRRPAGHAQAAIRPDHLDLVERRSRGFEFGTAYAASKFGLEGWMESLQAEVEPFGIQTLTVNPGFFRTELLTEESTNYAERHPSTTTASAGSSSWRSGTPRTASSPAIRPSSLRR